MNGLNFTLFTLVPPGDNMSGRRIAINRDAVRAIEEVDGQTVIYIKRTRMAPYGSVSELRVAEDFDTVFSRLNVITGGME